MVGARVETELDIMEGAVTEDDMVPVRSGMGMGADIESFDGDALCRVLDRRDEMVVDEADVAVLWSHADTRVLLGVP